MRYDFKQYLCYQLSRRIGKAVTPADISYTVYPKVNILGTLTKELVADVIYYGQHYLFNYNRLAATQFFDGVIQQMVGPIPKALTAQADIIAYIENKLKFSIENVTVDTTNPFFIRLMFDAQDWVGEVDVTRENRFWFAPYHAFIDTTTNLGSSGIDLANNFTQVSFAGKKWLSGNEKWNELGLDLSFSSDCTIWMELIANEVGNLYANIFSSEKSLTFGGLFTPRDINGSKNKPWLYGMYGSGFVAPTNAFIDDTPCKLAIVKTGNTYKFYQDGALKGSYTTTSTVPAWKYFGSAAVRSKQYVRNLVYHPQAFADADVLDVMAALL